LTVPERQAPAEGETLPHIQAAGGARLHYEDEGAGPVVILIHGGTGTGAYDWEHQRPALARGHRVITPDLRGHGRSSDPEDLLGLDQIAQDVLALVDVLDCRPAAIVSFSIGATAMLRLLCRRPDVTDAFVAIGASRAGRPQDVPAIVGGPWPRELRALRHEHGADDEHWRRLRRRLAESWAHDLALSDEELDAITIPTLIVCGDRDAIEPVESALDLARALPAGELLVLPACGHFASRDRPVELNAALETFLSRHLQEHR
jgi:pimeloyl-ACP methyl ester carboxylesterase